MQPQTLPISRTDENVDRKKSGKSLSKGGGYHKELHLLHYRRVQKYCRPTREACSPRLVDVVCPIDGATRAFSRPVSLADGQPKTCIPLCCRPRRRRVSSDPSWAICVCCLWPVVWSKEMRGVSGVSGRSCFYC